ncbi:hypothetical protein QE401_001855 [Pseudoroseomonas cervicalis]|nr:hypothetical protein [Pseudoroseomonas cervicalis]
MTSAIRRLVPPHRPRSAAFPGLSLARSAFSPRHRGITQRPRKVPPRGWRGFILGAVLLAVPVLSTSPAEAAGPRNACLEAVRAAELRHDLPDGLLVAIALAESGLHAHALNIGGRSYYPESRAEARRLLVNAPARSSVMAGCVQVNARVHARNGADWPLDADRAADWAARYLRQHYNTTGNWAAALRRWNGGGHAQQLVCRVDAKLQVVNPGSGALGNPSCGRGQIARVRRDGAALLELAEAGN